MSLKMIITITIFMHELVDECVALLNQRSITEPKFVHPEPRILTPHINEFLKLPPPQQP